MNDIDVFHVKHTPMGGMCTDRQSRQVPRETLS